MRSVETARRILGMSSSLGVQNVRVVANKVHPESRETLERALRGAGIPMDLVLPFREELARRDLEGAGVFDFADPVFEKEALRTIRSL
jgi:CO dehydrogenase nickel-insertion accessory protein CooC1